MTATAASAHRLLCVDDESAILRALHRVFRREGYTVLTANGGDEGLNLLHQTPVSLIISDQRMPGMSGVEFLRRSRQIAPDTIRILLTAYSDTEAAIAAINRGEVYRFLLKPWDDGELCLAVRDGIEHLALKLENRRLLQVTAQQNMRLRSFSQDLEAKVRERTRDLEEKSVRLEQLHAQLDRDFVDMVSVFARLIELHDAHTGSHSQRVATMAKAIAVEMELSAEEIRNVEIAGVLHDIGKIGLPPALINRPYRKLPESEQRVVERHPVLGQASVQVVGSLREVGRLIRSHHEHYDGTGYPDQLHGPAIPLGSRILAVANAYDLHAEQSHASLPLSAARKAAERAIITGSETWFDPRVVRFFGQALERISREDREFAEVPVPLSNLQEGMILSRDVYTRSGVMLMPKDESLRKSFVEKICTYHQSDPVAGDIYVYANWRR